MQRDDALIRAIYDGALRPESFDAILQEISERVGAYGAMVFDCRMIGQRRQVGVQHLSTVYDPAAVQAYIEGYNDYEVSDQDRFADLSSTGDEVNLIHDRALLRPGQNELPANVRAMARRGVVARYGALLSKENFNTDRFAFQFVEGHPLPNPEQLAWAESILSHLAKSLSIGRAIGAHRQIEVALSRFLDDLSFGVGVVSPNGTLILANAEFRRIAQDNHQVHLDSQNRLSFRGGSVPAGLRSLMVDDTAHGRFGARPRREAVFLPVTDGEQDEAGNGLFIEVCPLDDHPQLDRFGPGTRLVSILDSQRSQNINIDVVARYFPLSKSEVAVLGLLSSGYSNAEIADMRNRSVETVNSQLKSLLRKTNSRNRTELVKVALNLGAVMGSDPE